MGGEVEEQIPEIAFRILRQIICQTEGEPVAHPDARRGVPVLSPRHFVGACPGNGEDSPDSVNIAYDSLPVARFGAYQQLSESHLFRCLLEEPGAEAFARGFVSPAEFIGSVGGLAVSVAAPIKKDIRSGVLRQHCMEPSAAPAQQDVGYIGGGRGPCCRNP